jgi:hypothetical protein
MSRQAVLSMPLSFAIVLVAGIALSGTIRDDQEALAGAGVDSNLGTIADPIEPVKPEIPRIEPPPAPEVEPTPIPEAGPTPIPEAAPVVAEARPITPLPDIPTVVLSGPGESILAIADRVYGTQEMAGPLLDANPALVVEPWRPLPDRTLIRLP